jgi:hypothetical protein
MSQRLMSQTGGARPLRPPFGLPAWTPTAHAVAISLDMRGADGDSPSAVAAQVPLASALPPGTPVVVLGLAAQGGSIWTRFARGVSVPRAARCGALLARGYVDIGAGTDDVSGADLTWGFAPS